MLSVRTFEELGWTLVMPREPRENIVSYRCKEHRYQIVMNVLTHETKKWDLPYSGVDLQGNLFLPEMANPPMTDEEIGAVKKFLASYSRLPDEPSIEDELLTPEIAESFEFITSDFAGITDMDAHNKKYMGHYNKVLDVLAKSKPTPLVIKEYGEFNVPVPSCPAKGCTVRAIPLLDYNKYCPKCGQAWDREADIVHVDNPEHHEGVVK